MPQPRRDPSPIEPLVRAHFDAIYRYAACPVGREVGLDMAAELPRKRFGTSTASTRSVTFASG